MIMEGNFTEFAEKISVEIEKAIKSELSKRSIIERIGYAMFMPLTINIITEEGSASLVVLKDGIVRLRNQCSSAPDITLQSNFRTLTSLYNTRSPNRFVQAEEQGKIKIISNSWKGRQAERKLRELLGGYV